MKTITGDTADHLYRECWWKLPHLWKREQSRNGPVMAMQTPVCLELLNPRARVVFNEYRDANPFFHIAEVVWMFAGSGDVRFVEKFNKRYREYADPGTDLVWGAYGMRWQKTEDQIWEVIDILRTDPTSRQAVMSMWDSTYDLNTDHNDRPCNTQIMFRVVNGYLDMLVTNRSNDLVWGALGANVVHFTYLQELIATSIGVPVGTYRVVTNNLHFYPDMPNAERHARAKLYEEPPYPPTIPLLHDFETWDHLREDCQNYLEGRLGVNTYWMGEVAGPMMEAYLDKPRREDILQDMVECDWKTAAFEWMGRR
jgi:thymidylate synthase